MRRTVFAFAAAIAAMAIFHGPATAQHPAPVITGAPIESKQTSGATSRERHSSEIEASAKASQQRGDDPSARYRKFDIWWPDDVDEYRRMAHYAVMLLTVVTQKREELPLVRVYVRAGGRDLALRKIASMRSEYPAGSVVAKMFGRYREDAFYLAPGHAFMREGAVLADFTVNRKEMGVVKLPTSVGVERAKTFPADDPPTKGKPEAATFKDFMGRSFPGFPVPKL